MSQQELHDLLAELESERKQFDMVGGEQNHRLDEIVESLEQQKLYPKDFDQYSVLLTKINDAVVEYESQHPSAANVLASIAQVLRNFKV